MSKMQVKSYGYGLVYCVQCTIRTVPVGTRTICEKRRETLNCIYDCKDSVLMQIVTFLWTNGSWCTSPSLLYCVPTIPYNRYSTFAVLSHKEH